VNSFPFDADRLLRFAGDALLVYLALSVAQVIAPGLLLPGLGVGAALWKRRGVSRQAALAGSAWRGELPTVEYWLLLTAGAWLTAPPLLWLLAARSGETRVLGAIALALLLAIGLIFHQALVDIALPPDVLLPTVAVISLAGQAYACWPRQRVPAVALTLPAFGLGAIIAATPALETPTLAVTAIAAASACTAAGWVVLAATRSHRDAVGDLHSTRHLFETLVRMKIALDRERT
jgi:hypothetical protein